MGEGQWYYCLKHKTVEPYEACKAADRLGPYNTREEAALALERVAQREEEWETDPRFNEPEEEVDEWDADSRGWGPFRH
jgi:hypothetical protein